MYIKYTSLYTTLQMLLLLLLLLSAMMYHLGLGWLAGPLWPRRQEKNASRRENARNQTKQSTLGTNRASIGHQYH